MIKLPQTSPFTAKDQAKADISTGFIGRGSPRSSTAAYARAYGLIANSGNYTSTDRIFVSVEGMRIGRVGPDWAEIDRALEARATIIADAPYHRARPYNVGERELALYLILKGYTETPHHNYSLWNAPQ